MRRMVEIIGKYMEMLPPDTVSQEVGRRVGAGRTEGEK